MGVLNNGRTDAAIEQEQEVEQVEQEVIYVTFPDPDNFEPGQLFLTVAELNESQDAPGLNKVLIKSFEDHNIEGILKKNMFSSHGTEYQ